MTDRGEFARGYTRALRTYLAGPDENELRVAYELGRRAVHDELTVLDIAVVHHDALARALVDQSSSHQSPELVSMAGQFLLEALSTFEMATRGLREAREAATLERRQAAVLRQLSNFLADASLAVNALASLPEMLQLLAEHAREVIDASCCVVTTALPGHPPTTQLTSSGDHDEREEIYLAAARTLPTLEDGSRRLTHEQLQQLPSRRAFGAHTARAEVPQGWLAAPLAALDGRVFGAVHLFDKPSDFTDLDEAVLVHLAQMASAAIERAAFYSDRY